jgi:hypothetical protein
MAGWLASWRAWAWVFPLPPDGPLDILIALETAGLVESNVTVDGTATNAGSRTSKGHLVLTTRHLSTSRRYTGTHVRYCSKYGVRGLPGRFDRAESLVCSGRALS